jgi:hypothetical protein
MKKFGICFLALTLAVLLAAPAMAASITPYASMRLGTYWVDHDFNDYVPGWTTDDDDSSLMIDIADISRFGAKGQVGDIYGVVELGLVGQENTNEYTWSAAGGDNLAVYTRLLYGKWDFGGGTLLIGQDYTPVTYVSSQQGPGIFDDMRNTSYDLQNAFIGVGCLWDSRVPQIRLNLDNGFYVMIAQNDDGTPQMATPGGDIDLAVPKTVVGFNYKTEGLYLGPGFAYQSYEYDDGVGVFDDDITSWFLFLHGKVDLGAVALKFTGHYGENLGDYAISGRSNPYGPLLPATTTAFNPSRAVVVGDDVEDAECFGGWIQAAFPLDTGTLTLGWGYSSSENDDLVAPFDEADELMGYFVNYKIPITDNFSATPEFDYWDGMENAAGTDDPDHWALGITWQMDF